MDRNQKAAFIEDLKGRFEKADAAIAVAFTKLDVAQATALRKKFREAGVDYRVIKNTLAKLATEGTDYESLNEHFQGPTALVLGYDDVVAPAKVLSEFLKEKGNDEKIQVKGGVVQGKVASAADVQALADMPSLDELRATLAALLNTPATMLVRLVNTPGQQIAQVIKAKSEQDA